MAHLNAKFSFSPFSSPAAGVLPVHMAAMVSGLEADAPAERSDGDPFAPAICRLRDGTTVCIRPLQFGDAPLVRNFLRSLPADESLTTECLRCSLTLIAIRHGARAGEEVVLGLGTLERRDDHDATVLRLGLKVAVGYRGLGLGTLIGARLVAVARRLSALRVVVNVASGDSGMQNVCRRLGFVFAAGGSGRAVGWLRLDDGQSAG